jgi:hypothetical protein
MFVVGPACRPAQPRTRHDYHHDAKVKSEAATAVIEFLMMGGKTPETCWAVNKRQDNKLENCCIWLAIYFNYLKHFLVHSTAFFIYFSHWTMSSEIAILRTSLTFELITSFDVVKHLTVECNSVPVLLLILAYSKITSLQARLWPRGG